MSLQRKARVEKVEKEAKVITLARDQKVARKEAEMMIILSGPRDQLAMRTGGASPMKSMAPIV